MSRFLQLHLLTFHGPNNINRDDLGRPKTAIIGGAERLRISSQAIKRAIRTSDSFRAAMEGHLGERTARIAESEILPWILSNAEVEPEEARALARVTVAIFGKPETKPGKELRTRQLAFISEFEKQKLLDALASMLADSETRRLYLEASAEVALDEESVTDPDSESPKKEKKKKQSKKTAELIAELRQATLQKRDSAVDIAMFGRMLADAPAFNRDAAVQVAHAFTTHKATVESDYYTAMDDSKESSEDLGAGFIGSTGFGSGVYYTYVAVNLELLADNLGGDRDLAARAVKAFVEAAAHVTPTGKINSFANHGRPSYILAEAGDQAPRTLSGAFLKPVSNTAGDDLLALSIDALEKHRAAIDKAYGPTSDRAETMNVEAGKGTLAAILAFAGGSLGNA